MPLDVDPYCLGCISPPAARLAIGPIVGAVWREGEDLFVAKLLI